MSIRVPAYSLEIHPAAQEDLAALLEVYRQCEDFLSLGPVATASLEMVQKDIELSQSQNGIFCGIYQPDGKMIGVLDYVPSGWEGDTQAAYLSLLMITAPYRSQGIGKAVVEAFEQEIRQDPRLSVIWAGVQVNNPRAVRFWQMNGYRIVSGPKEYPDQTFAYDLRKDIQRRVV